MTKLVEYKLKTPVGEDEVRKLKVGDVIYVSGLVVSARDEAHRRLLEYAEKNLKVSVNLEGAALYHLGPLMKKEHGKWLTVSAGPTTSARMNAATPKVLEKYGVRIIIGKGGMSAAVADALKRYGAVYCHFTGGAGVLAAKNVKEVEGVEWSDLGMAEAMWVLRVENFGPLIVAMDSHGRSIYEDVQKQVEANVKKIYGQIEQ